MLVFGLFMLMVFVLPCVGAKFVGFWFGMTTLLLALVGLLTIVLHAAVTVQA